MTVTLTLANPALAGQTVTVAYDKPGAGSNNKLVGTAGGEVASFTDQPVTNDTAPPAFVSATVDDTLLVITFDKNLGAAANLANGAFTVKVASSAVSLAGTPSISGMSVTLTLANPAVAGQTVTVAYDKPGSGSNNKLVGTGGGEVVSFTDQPVTNDTTAPVFASATVTDASLVITFDKNLGAAASLANSAFTVKVAGSAVSLSGTPSISGLTVTLTLANPTLAGQRVTVAYDKPGTGSNNKLVGTGGAEVASFGDQSATNDTAPPEFSSATVTDASLVITFDKDLGVASSLASSAFAVKVGGAVVALTGRPSIAGRTVSLTLSEPVSTTATVTVAYEKPGSGANNKLVGTAGGEVASFTDQSVDERHDGPRLRVGDAQRHVPGADVQQAPGGRRESGRQRLRREGRRREP